jgi:hypothetical protein
MLTRKTEVLVVDIPKLEADARAQPAGSITVEPGRIRA